MNDGTGFRVIVQCFMVMVSFVAATADAERPTASFTYQSDGLEVQFTDTSTGNPLSWKWTFGEGAASSNQQNPTYTYLTTGVKVVSLTATNIDGSSTVWQSVSVGGTPEVRYFYFVPAAARAPGAAGSFFVTDVDVVNTGDASANAVFAWLPRDTDNSSPLIGEVFEIGAGATYRAADVLGSEFDLGEDGAFGALGLVSDADALVVMSRTFNVTDDGTFGQGIPGYPADGLVQAGDRVRIVFLSETDDVRSNLGLLNGTGTDLTVSWARYRPDGTPIDTGSRLLRAWENTQLNRVMGDVSPIEGAWMEVWTDTVDGAFAVYGSVLDNLTSDPTTVLPQ